MKIAGIEFFEGSVDEAVALALDGGLVLAPSGPGIACDLPRDPAYRRAVQEADLILPDSGAMVLAWNAVRGFSPSRRLSRLSGLTFLRRLLEDADVRLPGASLWVMPTESDLAQNVVWLRENGFSHLTQADCYLAPVYRREPDGTIPDTELAALIERRRPRFVILNVGGGTQEQLGSWLKRQLSYRPAIICTGAALAFLSGRQASIPPWADRLYLGWLLRCLAAPGKFIPRYWEARGIFWTVLRYGASMPPIEPQR